MLSAYDMLQSVIFTSRTIAYNGSFVHVGTKHNKETICDYLAESYSRKEDIISAFYTYFQKIKTQRKLIYGSISAMCGTRRFFTFLVYLVNSKEINTANNEVYFVNNFLFKIYFVYFEPGVTRGTYRQTHFIKLKLV